MDVLGVDRLWGTCGMLSMLRVANGGDDSIVVLSFNGTIVPVTSEASLFVYVLVFRQPLQLLGTMTIISFVV
jgi:hypothetical protein